MAKENLPEFGYLYARTEAIHCTPDSTKAEVAVWSNLDPEDQIEILAEASGIDPDNITPIDRTTNHGRVMVNFSKWRSSWDPHAPKIDPSLN